MLLNIIIILKLSTYLYLYIFLYSRMFIFYLHSNTTYCYPNFFMYLIKYTIRAVYVFLIISKFNIINSPQYLLLLLLQLSLFTTIIKRFQLFFIHFLQKGLFERGYFDIVNFGVQPFWRRIKIYYQTGNLRWI